MEKDLKIKINSKISICGRLEGSLKKPLFIVVHGLPGGTDVGLYEGATHYFAQQGYAAFRFNLYSWQKDARQLIDCTLQTHAADLDAVVRYFRKRGVKKIFVVGHSFGGPTILLSPKQDFDAVVLWDPSYNLSFTKMRYGFPGGTYVKQLKGYFMRWGAGVVLGNAMVKEVDALPWDNLTKKFHVPLKIIAASKGVLVLGAKKYYKNAKGTKELEIIKGATHFFDDTSGMREQVYKRTKQWFDRFR